MWARGFVGFAAVTILLLASPLRAASLAVLRIGNGTALLNGSSVPVSIDYFDTLIPNQSAPQSTVSISSTGNNALVLGGLAATKVRWLPRQMGRSSSPDIAPAW